MLESPQFGNNLWIFLVTFRRLTLRLKCPRLLHCSWNAFNVCCCNSSLQLSVTQRTHDIVGFSPRLAGDFNSTADLCLFAEATRKPS